MILNIRNWGAVGEAFIDADKPLIVMCGPNSTGKTYVSYLLYAVFSKFLRSPEFLISDFDMHLDEDISSSIMSRHSFDLTEKLFTSILQSTASQIKRKCIPLIFAISDDMAQEMFQEFIFGMSLGEGEFERIVTKPMFSKWKSGEHTVSIEKKADSKCVTLTVESHDEDRVGSMESIQYLNKMVSAFLLEMVFWNKGFARMLTIERNSVYTFSKELALNRSFGIGNLVALKTDAEPSAPERYPMAVTDSLKIAVDLQQIQKSRGYYYDYASRLEDNLLNGDIEINENGAVEFVPDLKTDSRHHLPIQMTSSIVKTMSSLIIYLKHIANKNDLLIIDEPEMNLHPDNQRLLACIFAELVNKGLKIVVSTHSDYIIREFNNLIMAAEIDLRKIKLEADESIPYTMNQRLQRSQMEVLYFNIEDSDRKVCVRHLPVTEFGFDVESIDDTILSQNRVTHNLSDILKYGEPDE